MCIEQFNVPTSLLLHTDLVTFTCLIYIMIYLSVSLALCDIFLLLMHQIVHINLRCKSKLLRQVCW